MEWLICGIGLKRTIDTNGNNMNELIYTGKKRTILISISILLVSIHTIYFYHAVRPEIEVSKLIKQGIRFLLTIGLLIATYKGMKFARILSIIFFSVGAVGAVIGFSTLDVPLVNKIPFIVMMCVYSIAVYHFGLSKSYKAFYDFQNDGRKTINKNSDM